MDNSFADQIVSALKQAYNFRKTSGKWMQEGTCPDCGQRTLYAAAQDPKIIRCGRANKCGFESSVRDALPDLFDDWSKRFQQSEENPTAAADAYLFHARGLSLKGLRGHYSQETYTQNGHSTATIRFPLPGGSWWERYIDRPARFGKRKAGFKFGGTWSGHCWMHPDDDFKALAQCDEIWIAEGIFDALALRETFKRHQGDKAKPGRGAVSAMTVNVWPEHFVAELKAAVESAKLDKRPRLIFAFDVGAAGISYTRKFVKRARKEGWRASAAQVRPDGEGTKRDWNDLHQLQTALGNDGSEGPMSPSAIEDYRHNGKITIAETASEKARLIHARRPFGSFYFRFEGKVYWARAKAEKSDDDGDPEITIEHTEIANCDFRILYREHDPIDDETAYFIHVRFPGRIPDTKARFSPSCSNNGEFKKRLFACGGMWTGSQEQLDRILRDQMRDLRTVEALKFTGYSQAHDAWVLGDLAVHKSRIIGQSEDKYFQIGRSSVKLLTTERILHITPAANDPQVDWLVDVWNAWGPRGFVALGFFTMSLFAVQIRELHKSLGFLEIHGEAGSGKTTLVEFMWKLLGRSGYEGFDPNKATYPAIGRNFAKVSGLPVGLIESGRDDEKAKHTRAFDWRELLTLYNGRSPRATGVKSKGNETSEPPFLGSIYLMQNYPIDSDPAVLERIMSLRIDRSCWSETSRAAAIRLERYDAETASAWIAHACRSGEKWLKAFFARFEHHDHEMIKRVADLRHPRITKCHAQLAAAVEALATIAPSEAIPRSAIGETLAFIDQMALERQSASAADHPTVQRFWDIVDDISSSESDDDYHTGRSINQSRVPDRYYAIRLTDFERLARNRGLIPPDSFELKKHLKGSRSRKFLGAKPVNTHANGTRHCWVFQNPNWKGEAA